MSPPRFPLAEIQLKALVAQLGDAVVLEDERRRLHTANEAFCRTFAIDAPPEALQGADCAAAAEQAAALFEDPEAFLGRIDELLRRREPRSGERLVLRDGRTLERDYIPIWSDATYRGHLWVYRDVTPLADAAREVERAREHLERFVDMLGHEMRSPLATANLATQELLGAELPPPQTTLLRTVSAALQSLAALLDETQDRALARLDRAPLALHREPCRLVDEVRAVLLIEQRAALQRGLSLDSELSCAEDLVLHMDRHRFRMVVSNLVRNAIRYTEQGSVRVVVRTDPGTRPQRRRIEVLVIDTGVGVPPHDEERIFQPYTRGAHSGDGGLGLGLYLCRQVALAMGGTVSLLQSSCDGSVFQLQFEASEVTDATGEGALTDRTVLVIDDDPSMTRLLALVIERANGAPVVANTSRAALKALKKHAPDVAIVDYSLGQRSSEHLIQALKDLAIPTVVVSGHDEPNLLASTVAGEVHAWLRKPASASAVINALHSALSDTD